jgi:hypothetical protein
MRYVLIKHSSSMFMVIWMVARELYLRVLVIKLIDLYTTSKKEKSHARSRFNSRTLELNRVSRDNSPPLSCPHLQG